MSSRQEALFTPNSATSNSSPSSPRLADPPPTLQQRRLGIVPMLPVVGLLHEGDFLDEPIPRYDSRSCLPYPENHGRTVRFGNLRKMTTLEKQFAHRVESNAFHQSALQRLHNADEFRRRDYDVKRQYLHYYLHEADSAQTVGGVVEQMSAFIETRRQQIARIDKQNERMCWFYRFFEALHEKIHTEEISTVIELMEAQCKDIYSDLDAEQFRELFEATTPEQLLLPSAQFFLCHAAVAYGVPYLDFREMLELRHVPYVLQGNGETFAVIDLVNRMI
jgi:hypothetical protein